MLCVGREYEVNVFDSYLLKTTYGGNAAKIHQNAKIEQVIELSLVIHKTGIE